MATTWFEQGIEQGLVRGQRRVLQQQLEKRFGPLSPDALATLESWQSERLDDVALKLLDAKSLDELGLGEDKPT
jgi:hypothetical protein